VNGRQANNRHQKQADSDAQMLARRPFFAPAWRKARRVALVVSIALAALAIPASASADSLPVGALAASSLPTAPPALALDAQGQAQIAWLLPSPDGAQLQLQLLQPLTNQRVVVASAPLSQSPESLSLDPAPLIQHTTAGTQLAWSQPLTQTRRITRYTWGRELDRVAWEIPLTPIWAYAMSVDGSVFTAWAESEHLVILDLTRQISTTLTLDAGTMVRKLLLTTDEQGQAHIAWSQIAPDGTPLGLFYFPANAESRPIRVAMGGVPLRLVATSRAIHLLWSYHGALYDSASAAWEKPSKITEHLASDRAVAAAPTHEGYLWAVWQEGDQLRQGCSLDWAGTTSPLFQVVGTVSPALALDARDTPHLAWLSQETEPERWVLYDFSEERGPHQLAVRTPAGGDVIHAATTVVAESNLSPEAWQHVAFFLQRQEASDPAGGPLIELGVDRNGTDGWTAPLQLELLDPTYTYRILAIGTTIEGQEKHVWGEPFVAGAVSAPATWLIRLGPDGPVHGESEWLIVGNTRPPEAFDVYASIPSGSKRTSSCAVLEPPQLTYYLGHVQPLGTRWGSMYSWQRLRVDMGTLPNGTYQLIARPLRNGQVAGPEIRSEPFRVDNVLVPQLEVMTPQSPIFMPDVLQASAMAFDLDGPLQRVDFFLERDQPYAPPAQGLAEREVTWLGSDDDGIDGWSVRTPIRATWLGKGWRIRAIARDSQGLTAEAVSRRTFEIRPPSDLTLQITEPISGTVVSGVITVRVKARSQERTNARLDLYVGHDLNALRRLGSMIRSEAGWEWTWNTKRLLDGDYVLLAVADDGINDEVTQATIKVRNRSFGGEVAFSDMGPTLKGLTMLRWVSSEGGEIENVRFWARDQAGTWWPIGEDRSPDGGWGILWNTQHWLDGTYTVRAEVTTRGGKVGQAERDIEIRNHIISVTLNPLSSSHLSGLERVFWRVRDGTTSTLTVSIEYSPDDGVHWLPITTQPASAGSFLWDTRDYPDSPRARLRLLASDGQHRFRTISSRFALSNDNAPPRVALLAPQSGKPQSGQIRVVWQAWDPEGLPLTLALQYRQQGESSWQPIADGLINTGQYIWEARVPAGTYDLRITAKDAEGNESSDIRSDIRLVGNRPPVVRLVWPQADEHIEQEAAILWRALDPDGDPLHIDLYYSDNGGRAWFPLAEGLENTGYYLWRVLFLPPGNQYRIRIVARDRYAQAIDENSGIFTVESAPAPSLSLLSPLDGQTISGVQFIRWFTRDVAISPKIEIRLRPQNDVEWQALATNLPDHGLYIWDTARHQDGVYELQLSATTSNGQSIKAKPIQVTIANTPNHRPQVRLLAPRGGEHWAGFREIRWQAWDMDQEPLTATIQISKDGGKHWEELSQMDAQIASYLWDTSQTFASNGVLLRVRVSDGNLSSTASVSAPLVLLNDGNTPPSVWVFRPIDPLGSSQAQILRWLAEDREGTPLYLDAWLETVDGSRCLVGRNLANTGEHFFEAAIDPEQRYRFCMVADDETYRTESCSAIWQPRRPEGQLPELEIRAPKAKATLEGQVDVEWTASDPLGESLRIRLEYSINGGKSWTYLSERSTSTDRYTWDTTRLPNGPCLLRVTADNGHFKRRRTIGPLLIRNPGRERPRVSLVVSEASARWNGNQEILWRATDPDGDPLQITLAYSVGPNGPWKNIAQALDNRGTLVWDTSRVPNTTDLWLRISASDGRFTQEAYAGPVQIENRVNPRVTLQTPEGNLWAGEVSLSWYSILPETTPSARVSLQASIDGGRSWQEIAGGLDPSGKLRWDTRQIGDNIPVQLRIVTSATFRQGIFAPKPVTIRGNRFQSPPDPFAWP